LICSKFIAGLGVEETRWDSVIHGQAPVVRSLSAFAAAPHSNAFIFAGSSGVGKTAAAWALANELGCDPDWGGVVEIPSGTHARSKTCGRVLRRHEGRGV